MILLTQPHIHEIDTRRIYGFLSYHPDRFGLGIRIVTSWKYGGWFTLSLTFGPCELDLQLVRNP